MCHCFLNLIYSCGFHSLFRFVYSVQNVQNDNTPITPCNYEFQMTEYPQLSITYWHKMAHHYAGLHLIISIICIWLPYRMHLQTNRMPN